MFRDKEPSENDEKRQVEASLVKSEGDPDDKMMFLGSQKRKSLDLLGESHVGLGGFVSKPSNDRSFSQSLDLLNQSGLDRDGFVGNNDNKVFSSQELTFSYLCENSKSGCSSVKGKGVSFEQVGQGEEEKWVERDFLQLSGGSSGKGCGLSKREAEEEREKGERGDSSKKPKVEALRLSLAPPDVSLSLTASNAAPAVNSEAAAAAAQPMVRPSRSVQSWALSNGNTQTTYSNDFTAASLSYSYSHPHSHNPSCSLTYCSTENYENSVGSRRREGDQIWNCGEGTNGSVHSRFKPIGDGVGLSSNGNGVGYALLNRGRPFARDLGSSIYRPAGSDSSSFFPSELPARPTMETVCSVDSLSRSLNQVKGSNSLDERRAVARKPSTGERIVRDVVTEPVHVMSQLCQEFPAETANLVKEYLHSVITAPERKDELVYLQNMLNRRSDITKDTLSKAHKTQLEIFVALKFGRSELASGKVHLQPNELIEIFLYNRCRNVNCRALLPVDDCDCKICSTKQGFCRECMCPVCYNFDSASNTCNWVGCDACYHWCHAACGIEKSHIRPGPSSKSPGATEMQFYCLGCGHASEMFGFVKDVFVSCAKEWDLQTLLKELDCVRRIFKGSEDRKGKELYLKAADLITRLERRAMSPADACNFIIYFFTSKSSKEDSSEYFSTGMTAKVPTASQGGLINDKVPLSMSNASQNSAAASMLHTLRPFDVCNSNARPASDQSFKDDSLRKFSKKDSNDSLESIVRIKEAEARMFQNRADEARKEVEAYQQLVQARTDKLEQEYADKLAKLCLQETEERRRKKVDELKIVESSHNDYCSMKLRMQAEISGLLERMEATRQLWV